VTVRAARVLLCALVLGAAARCGGGGQLHERYGSYREAILDRALERKLIPVWLPPSATQIDCQVRLDGERAWLRFRLPPADLAILRRSMKPLTTPQLLKARVPTPQGAPWWDFVLPPSNAWEEVHVGASSLVPENTYVAQDRKTGTLFSWRVSAVAAPPRPSPSPAPKPAPAPARRRAR
jgi:hypothetical protein